jgi:hypothetical protein
MKNHLEKVHPELFAQYIEMTTKRNAEKVISI